RFWPGFAADEPLARFEPMNRLPVSGTYPDNTSAVNADLWGRAVFDRLAGFDSRPSPDTKVYASHTAGGSQRPDGEWHAPDRAYKAVGDAMTALAREANGLADPTTLSVTA